jgi:hypothetical protein
VSCFFCNGANHPVAILPTKLRVERTGKARSLLERIHRAVSRIVVFGLTSWRLSP